MHRVLWSHILRNRKKKRDLIHFNSNFLSQSRNVALHVSRNEIFPNLSENKVQTILFSRPMSSAATLLLSHNDRLIGCRFL